MARNPDLIMEVERNFYICFVVMVSSWPDSDGKELGKTATLSCANEFLDLSRFFPISSLSLYPFLFSLNLSGWLPQPSIPDHEHGWNIPLPDMDGLTNHERWVDGRRRTFL